MNKRYERRSDKSGDNKAVVQDGAPEEIVTGVPATEEVPAGSPQFDVFKEVAEHSADDQEIGSNALSVEDRDNRQEAATKAKAKSRLSMDEIDAMAGEMAADSARDVKKVVTEANGDTLTVSITTKHGHNRVSADVKDWSKSGVQKALDEIRKKIDGDAPTSEPKDKLAEAVREVASGKAT